MLVQEHCTLDIYLLKSAVIGEPAIQNYFNTFRLIYLAERILINSEILLL